MYFDECKTAKDLSEAIERLKQNTKLVLKSGTPTNISAQMRMRIRISQEGDNYFPNPKKTSPDLDWSEPYVEAMDFLMNRLGIPLPSMESDPYFGLLTIQAKCSGTETATGKDSKPEKISDKPTRLQRKLQQESHIIAILEANPNIKQITLAHQIGVSVPTISRSGAWKEHQRLKFARQQQAIKDLRLSQE